MQRHYSLLSLGDSYTIGEAVPLHQNFPYQTVQLLRRNGHHFAAPEIVAKTGWTTEELQSAMAQYTFSTKYDVVSLLIGVNNQYRGQEIVLYKQHLECLLEKSIELTGGKKDHVFVLSIPDYSQTPYSVDKDKELIRKEIDEYNHLNMALSIQYKVQYIDITEDFRATAYKEILLTADGLHPSAKEYGKWAVKLSEAIGKLVKK